MLERWEQIDCHQSIVEVKVRVSKCEAVISDQIGVLFLGHPVYLSAIV